MGKTDNFESWLSGVDLGSNEDIYDLYNSISNFEKSGKFHTTKEVTNEGYQYLIKADGNEDSLFLPSDEAKFAFLHHLKTNYTDAAEDDIDKWSEIKKDLGRVD